LSDEDDIGDATASNNLCVEVDSDNNTYEDETTLDSDDNHPMSRLVLGK
jgi:hypothetical protein